MEPLLRLGLTFGMIVTLGGLWFGLQSFVRRYFPSMAAGPGEDPFRARFGCGGCHGAECSGDSRQGP